MQQRVAAMQGLARRACDDPSVHAPPSRWAANCAAVATPGRFRLAALRLTSGSVPEVRVIARLDAGDSVASGIRTAWFGMVAA